MSFLGNAYSTVAFNRESPGADYDHPFTEDILGREPSKDPLRSSPVPLEKRIQVVGLMNHWQLVNLTSLLVIPTRFEDISGAVITDFDLNAGVWKLGSRFGGSDFNKGHVNVVMPLPPVLIDLLNTYAGISIFDEMAHDFDRIAPLLRAIERRAHDLGIPLEQSRKNAA